MDTDAAESSGYSEEKPERTPAQWHSYWQRQFDAAKKRVRTFQKQGNKVIERFLDKRVAYETDDDNTFRLNLFHTNIVTMQSMLYGSVPKISVKREHQDPDDDVARVAGLLFSRMLELDVQGSGDDLGSSLRAGLQDRLLPGLGVCRVRYEFETVTVPQIQPDGSVVEAEMVSYESAPIEYVHWQDFLWGWCRTWPDCPWLAFRSWMDKDEVTARFGEKVCKQLEFKKQMTSGGAENNGAESDDDKNNVQKAEIWEFWNKEDRRVYWWSQGADIILDIVDDPLQLDNFWPLPQPMMANLTTTLLQPMADFVIAQDLYNQIDTLQTRIGIITRAVKVVGVYDKSSQGVQRMLTEGVENDLIPVDNWAMFAEKGGLKGQVDWFPVQDVVGVLQTLRQLLGETIEMLYQVTGMSDVLRGANTDQYTSDGTQQLKAKFGSIRVQALQDEFARWASELESLKAEIIAKHFDPQSIVGQSSARYLPQADQALIAPALELMKNPEMKWRVDIKPESIAMVDYAQLKAERTEFLNAMATYIQSAQAAAQQIPGSIPVMLEMLKWGMAGFKGSEYLEGTMDRAIEQANQAAQQQQGANPEQQRQQAEYQAEMQKIQAKLQADMQLIQAKSQAESDKAMMAHQHKMEQEMAKQQGDMQKIMADLRADLQTIAAKLDADLQTEQSQAVNAAAEAQVEHENELVEMNTEHEHNMVEMGAEHATNMQEKSYDAEVAARSQNSQTDTD